MDKTHFAPDTRYTLTLRGADGKARPANLYVYRVYDAFMVARATSGDGLLRKVPYGESQVNNKVLFLFPIGPTGQRT